MFVNGVGLRVGPSLEDRAHRSLLEKGGMPVQWPGLTSPGDKLTLIKELRFLNF